MWWPSNLATPLVLSGSAVALLGAAAGRVRARERRLQTELRDERLRARCVDELIRGCRESSAGVLAALERALRARESAIDCMLVFTPSGGELYCTHAGGARAEHYRAAAIARDDARSLVARAAATGNRVALAAGDAGVIPTDRSALAFPIVDGGAIRAVAYVSSAQTGAMVRPDALAETVERAAIPYAMALDREADRAAATHDGLTGLLSPRAFRRQLHDEFARTAAHGSRPLSLWFVDTDDFKIVNDRFGHRRGDAVLQTMAALLRAHVVPGRDVAARNGGDEFCALLRGCGKSEAIERAVAFCDAVRRHDFNVPIAVTASVGVATYPYDASAAGALLEAADAAMYHGKRNGRDRVAFRDDGGRYAVISAEAGTESSRSIPRWRSGPELSCARHSSS